MAEPRGPKQTKSVRIDFWKSEKKLLLGLNRGSIESISKPENLFHLSRDKFADMQSQILRLEYLDFNIAQKRTSFRSILTVQCPTSIWLVNMATRRVIGGGRLDKRFRKNEQISGVYVAHEGRVVCAFTSQSRAILLLIRENEDKIDLVFLEGVQLEIGGITGHNQFGK